MAEHGKMTNMQGYSNGYKPPHGSAGKAAYGEYSHKSNPLAVPKKAARHLKYQSLEPMPTSPK
jgi:hypothetical protein